MTPMSATFLSWISSVQSDVEIALGRFLPDPAGALEQLHGAMRYATLDGGKRVRPLLLYATGALFDAPPELLARAAAAVEMIHVYSLVHDDMPCMDDDALRRGKPTVHVRYDEATALLVGDALQAQAFITLSEIPLAIEGSANAASASAATVLQLIKILANVSGSTGMCGGQAIDLASVGLPLTLVQLEHMHKLKTGALLRAAVLMGAVCGNNSADEMAALDAYSAAVGLSFQVVDDVLDATADSSTLGKTAGKDAMDNKPTYVSLLGLDASVQLAEQLRQNAHQALACFGAKAQHLHDLADFVVQRKA